MEEYEDWKDIPGYVGLYQASSHGRIRSVRRLVKSQIDIGVRIHKTTLSQQPNSKGRMRVALCRHIDGVKNVVVSYMQVHRLVFLAFHGEIPEGMNVLHDDGDHLHNTPDNLYAGTQKTNMADKIRHGTQQIGDTSPYHKLTQADVLVIRSSEKTQPELAKEFGVTQAAISHVKTFKTWKHLVPSVIVNEFNGVIHEQDQATCN